MTPAEFVARDALTFWAGTLAALPPIAGVAWLARRRIAAAVDRFWDRVDPPEPDPLAAARQFAQSQVGKPYVYGAVDVPDDRYSGSHIDPVKVTETLDEWDRVLGAPDREDGADG